MTMPKKKAMRTLADEAAGTRSYDGLPANGLYYIALQIGITPYGEGPPGCGKTAGWICLAEAMDRWLYVFVGSDREPTDLSGIPFQKVRTVRFPDEQKAKLYGKITNCLVDGVSHEVACWSSMPAEWAVDLFTKPSMLLMDEMTNIGPQMQAACHTPMAEGKIGGLPIRAADCWIGALGNPAEYATNGTPFSPAFANRMPHFKWQPDDESFDIGLENGLDFPAPKVPLMPKDWKEQVQPHIEHLCLMVRLYRKHAAGSFMQMPYLDPTKGEGSGVDMAKASKAWPSFRTTEYAIRLAAAVRLLGLPGPQEDSAVKNAFTACVGAEQTDQFFRWLEERDLPDVEQELAKAIVSMQAGNKTYPQGYQPVLRPDQLLCFFLSLQDAVRRNKTKDRWQAGMHIWESYHDVNLPIVASTGRGWTRQGMREFGWECSKFFSQELAPRLNAAAGISR